MSFSLHEESENTAVVKVLLYELLLERVFENLRKEELIVCKNVCQKWRKVGQIVDCKRTLISEYFYPFRILRFETGNNFPVDVQMDPCVLNHLSVGTEDLEKTLIRDIPKLYASPDLMLLIEGNNVKNGKKRRWKRAKIINAIRAMFNPHCKIIGIDAQFGITGKTDFDVKPLNGVPNVINFNVCHLFGVSCFLFPSFKGVEIEVFNRLSEFQMDSNTKGVVLFSSGVSIRGEYLEYPSVQELIYSLNGQFALGGAHVNENVVNHIPRTIYSDETSNYYFINGYPPYNPMFNPQQMSLIGIKFSGKNVRSCSLVVEFNRDDVEINPSEDLSQIAEQVKEFKANLHFDADCNASRETVAFLFFNYQRYRSYVKSTGNANAGVDIFYSLFPKTRIIGLLTHAQYEHNYWPNISERRVKVLPKDDNNKPLLFPSTKSIASFVIFYLIKE